MYNKHEPTKENECGEAILTQGRSCRDCGCSCYRKGMSQSQAIADNNRLVANKHREMKSE